ncbi:MAG: hypothetical protein Q9168_006409, partial [Polycauliona sp. 1 TL-2023]
MQNIKGAVNYASEKIQGGGAQASKEANKSIAKDGQAPIGTRFQAAGDMMSDKMNQHSHERSSAFQLQRRFASSGEEAQTQSEPVADGAEAQHGDNSIAASSTGAESENAMHEGRGSSAQQDHSTLGEIAESAADKAKETASSAFDAIAGSGASSEMGGRPYEGRGMNRNDAPPSSSVYIGNLFFDVREDDLRKKFEECGTIENVKLVMDNRGLSKG